MLLIFVNFLMFMVLCSQRLGLICNDSFLVYFNVLSQQLSQKIRYYLITDSKPQNFLSCVSIQNCLHLCEDHMTVVTSLLSRKCSFLGVIISLANRQNTKTSEELGRDA